uniref:Probable helicase MAGATAMA 3 n=1 Tax=Elaeis guineensis var. tenera TaxID=51953 RepID=A0A6I9QAS6_ELAGV|nr:probable helicase MAGATAMA 3 [Elaeis guineensis]
METISNAPYSEIVSIEEASSQEFYDIRVHCWKNESINGGKEIYKPMPYDVFILSNIKLETVSDLKRNGSLFNLCSIVKVEEDGGSTTDFKVRASKHIEISDGMKQSLFMIFLGNITTNSRIWKSLHVGSLATGNLTIIKDVLCPDSSVCDACVLCSSESRNTNNMCLDGASELNDLQISAVLGSISEMQCNHKCSVKLIWGPPGTGKTKIVSKLLWAVLGMKHKVLTCTSTHVAIWEVTSCLLKVAKKNKQGSRGTIPLYTNWEIFSSSFISRKEFEDMATLLNELENFKKLLSEASFVDKELQEIFMQLEGNRLDSLQGWQCKSSLQFLICEARCECLRLLKAVKDSIHISYFHEKNLIREFCLQNASLIFCTASSSFELLSVQIQPLDLIIIDDASQLKECESAIPLQLQGLKHAVLVGDENQLPAMVKSKVSEAAGLGRSLFQRLSSLGISKQLLEVQYRMHPSISLFPNAEFYSGKMLDGPNVKTKAYERQFLPGIMFGPFSFINVTHGEEEVDDVSHSIKNMVEVGVVLQIVRRHCLWIVGNGETIVKCHSVWEALVRSAKDRGCLFDADQDKILAKAILDAKSEDCVDNLLNSDSILLAGAKWKGDGCAVALTVIREDCLQGDSDW